MRVNTAEENVYLDVYCITEYYDLCNKPKTSLFFFLREGKSIENMNEKYHNLKIILCIALLFKNIL